MPRRSTSGSEASARPSSAFRFCPPDRVANSASGSSSRSEQSRWTGWSASPWPVACPCSPERMTSATVPPRPLGSVNSSVDAIFESTRYFRAARRRRGRETIQDTCILRVIRWPEKQRIQGDGRIRRWARIPEAGGRYLRVVLLPDGETVHNAFFDRGFRP